MRPSCLQCALTLLTLALTLTAACDKAAAPAPTSEAEAPLTAPPEAAPQALTPPNTPDEPAAPTPPTAPAPPVAQAAQDHVTTAAKRELVIGAWVIHHSSAEAWAEHTKTKQKHVLYSQKSGLRDCKTNLEREEQHRADYQVTGALISVVGDVISYYVSEYGDCGGAHPFAYTGFGSLDLKTLKAVALNSLFDDAQINAALDADAFVKKVRAQEMSDDCSLMVESPDAKRTSFAFHHIKGDKVAVRVGLSHKYEVCRGSFAQVGVYLKPTATLMKQLKEAQAAGLLMDKLLPKLPK